jgi:hypothetical protein
MFLIGRASILNPFQKKSMKVISNMKGIVNKKPEHDEEL